MSKDELLRYPIARLAAHKDTACAVDYGRIEELCHLIRQVMSDFAVPDS
jgi:hypothetical protein